MAAGADGLERAHLVMGIDAQGDVDLFGTDDPGRAEDRYRAMLATHRDVRANWRPDAGGPAVDQPSPR